MPATLVDEPLPPVFVKVTGSWGLEAAAMPAGEALAVDLVFICSDPRPSAELLVFSPPPAGGLTSGFAASRTAGVTQAPFPAQSKCRATTKGGKSEGKGLTPGFPSVSW